VAILDSAVCEISKIDNKHCESIIYVSKKNNIKLNFDNNTLVEENMDISDQTVTNISIGITIGIFLLIVGMILIATYH
jgi:hypothetical protein